ncbi:MAG TPA: beta-propeller fold lactonase family protein, partial [Chthoniobacteraceae bacterium]
MSPFPLTRRSFLKASAAVAGLTPIFAEAPKARAASENRLFAYVGTFSSSLPVVRPGQVDLPPGNGRGIHVFEVDRASGALTSRGLHEQKTGPTSLVLNSAGTRLYSSNETEHLAENDAGSISAFSIDRSTGEITVMNTASSGGAGPTYVSLHPSGRFLFAANYFGGSIVVLPIRPDGSLGAATDFKQDAGTVGPKKATNAPPGSFAFSGHDVPHAHMIEPDPTGRFVLSVDLGLDQILVWKFDDHSGVLTPND